MAVVSFWEIEEDFGSRLGVVEGGSDHGRGSQNSYNVRQIHTKSSVKQFHSFHSIREHWQ